MKIVNWKLKIIAGILFCGILLLPAMASAAFSFVPCGTERDASGAITNPCQLKHMIFLVIRMINYLVSVAAIVAMYQIISAGFWMVASLGIPEKIKTAREGLNHAIIGFAMILLSFVLLNLLVNGLFGQGGLDTTKDRQWYDPICIYGIGDTASQDKCPLGVSQQKP